MAEFQGMYAELTERILKTFYQVSRELGHGFFESVYRRSMAIALVQEGLKVQEEVAMPVSFRGQQVGVFFADMLVNDVILLEFKVADGVSEAAKAQLIHYLRSSPVEVGYVLAFGDPPKYKRLIFTNDRKQTASHHP